MISLSRFAALTCLGIASFLSLCLAEAPQKPPKVKRVFTNDDLATHHDPSPPQNENSSGLATTDEGSGSATVATPKEQKHTQTHWSEELKKINQDLKQIEEQEQKYKDNLSKFQDSLATAENDFQKQTIQWQIDDLQTHLDRIAQKRKAAESQKEAIMKEIAKKKE